MLLIRILLTLLILTMLLPGWGFLDTSHAYETNESGLTLDVGTVDVDTVGVLPSAE